MAGVGVPNAQYAPPAAGYAAPPGQWGAPPPGYSSPSAAGSSSSTNGMAIAALVLGILSFVCLGPIGGILAIIFGILGMKKAAEIGSGRGMSIAGIVLGIVGTLAFVALIIVIVAVGDSASNSLNDSFGAADPSNYEVTTETCEVDSIGSVTFTGSIENTGNKSYSYNIKGQIRDADSNVLLESTNDYVDVPEDDTVRWSMTAFLDEPTNVTCAVTGVDNWFN